MDLASFKDYKALLKARLEELRKLRSGLTLKKLAEKIPIQYTYLSKVLNDRDIHLSEDDLFRASQVLEFFPQEIDYILQLRAYQTAVLPARREHAFRKLSSLKKEVQVHANINAGNDTRLTQEMSYLLDPFSVVVYMALHLSSVRGDPRVLCALLGISLKKLKGILKNLSSLDLIEMGTGPLSVLHVKPNRSHYSKEHPLMRVHQHLFKMASLNQLLNLSDDEKECFQATFTADGGTMDAIRKEFQIFLKKVQELAQGSKKSERVLQLNFDLFHWY